jgi:FAD/FMN-containing dehydrogenase
VPSLDAAELIQPTAMRLVARHLDATPPVAVPDGGSYVMIDCADHEDPSPQLLDALAGSPVVIDSALTTDSAQRERLIQFRDRLTEAIASASTGLGVPTFKLDVAVPLGALDELIAVAQAAADADGSELIPFGHLAEGNVHLNHLGANDPDRIASVVLTKVAELGGTISAEHGIGIAKTRWLHLIRSDAELRAQASIKAALDPDHLLNPGVLFPGPRSAPQVP